MNNFYIKLDTLAYIVGCDAGFLIDKVKGFPSEVTKDNVLIMVNDDVVKTLMSLYQTEQDSQIIVALMEKSQKLKDSIYTN